MIDDNSSVASAVSADWSPTMLRNAPGTAHATVALCLFLASGFFADSAPTSVKLHTDSLVVALDAKSAWTIRSVDFKGERLIIPAGGQGAVLMPPSGRWIGSAMGPDEAATISSFAVSVDDQPVLGGGAVDLKGTRFRLRKESMLDQFRHSAETIIEGDTIHQRHEFTAAADMDLKTFHGFIYSFSPKADSWLAGTAGGDLAQGEFKSANAHVPAASVRWLALHNAEAGKGVVIHFQTPFTGRRGAARIWDAKSYRKLLFQPRLRKVSAGTRLEYRMAMRFIDAKADEWESSARKAAAELQVRFPALEAATEDESGIPQTGLLTLKSKNYTIPIAAERAWTIERMLHRGTEFSGNNGFYGTVLTPVGGKWWGTGHGEGGREVVRSLTLTADGSSRPIRMADTVAGRKVRLRKESTIWKFKAVVDVEVTDEHVLEHTRLEVLEDCETSILYFFMHCFPPTTKAWLAELADGSIEEGRLTDAKKMAVTKDTRWVAQFDPESNRGLLCYTPKVITGTRSASLIWDLDRYHKYYLCQNRGQKFRQGDVLDYSVIVKVVEGETGNWTATKKAAEALKRQFPPER